MKIEDFVKLGIDKELAKKCVDFVGEKISAYEKELASFKEKEGLHQQAIDKLKIDNSLDLAILKANGKNAKAIRALVDLEKVSIGEDGKVVGISEQIESLLKANDSKFLFESGSEIKLSGVTPFNSENTVVSKEDFSKMSYKERVDLYNENADVYRNIKAD